MRYELKSIPYWAFIKIAFFVNLIGGFVIGIFYAIFFGLFMTAMSNLGQYGFEEFDDISAPLGFMVIFMPFFFAFACAFFNTLFGLIFVFIYNMISKLIGGLELNLEPVTSNQISMPTPKPITAQTSLSAPPPPPHVKNAPPPPPPSSTPPTATEAPAPIDKPEDNNSTKKDDDNLN